MVVALPCSVLGDFSLIIAPLVRSLSQWLRQEILAANDEAKTRTSSRSARSDGKNLPAKSDFIWMDENAWWLNLLFPLSFCRSEHASTRVLFVFSRFFSLVVWGFSLSEFFPLCSHQVRLRTEFLGWSPWHPEEPGTTPWRPWQAESPAGATTMATNVIVFFVEEILANSRFGQMFAVRFNNRPNICPNPWECFKCLMFSVKCLRLLSLLSRKKSRLMVAVAEADRSLGSAVLGEGGSRCF